ncbi:MAG TPA: sialidase family protein [Candidatus Hydrogenedentes bacterium]|nr:sialidase family protein [Candidatus Hydrogenedentota bacterium]HNT86983.1 sialidase family protein [Candidatus Hydrogenedentota bacterium]
MKKDNRWRFFVLMFGLGLLGMISTTSYGEREAVTIVDYDIQLDSIRSGFDKVTCWVHPRAGTIPGEPPTVVMTMQKLLLSGSDVFYALNEMRSDDLGRTWTGPVEHESLGRTQEADTVAVVCDFTPKWHAASAKLLGTGHVARYKNDRLAGDYPRQTAYSWYDPEARTWAPWRTVDMPADPKFHSSGAGSTQRVDLPNGDILLPFYFKAKGEKTASSSVMRCRFDGETLHYLQHGDEMTVDEPRGLGEPSLVDFKGMYYLTLRNDVKGYVTRGADGLHFEPVRPWTFDDGAELGSYNTQQHWVSHKDALFLVYTRRDPKYDHVFRHRAPLRIAQVDPDRLCVLRATERILVPERGARLGNFAVTRVNDQETWVTVAEWMQPVGCERYGSDNAVYAARIIWRDQDRTDSGTSLF